MLKRLVLMILSNPLWLIRRFKKIKSDEIWRNILDKLVWRIRYIFRTAPVFQVSKFMGSSFFRMILVIHNYFPINNWPQRIILRGKILYFIYQYMFSRVWYNLYHDFTFQSENSLWKNDFSVHYYSSCRFSVTHTNFHPWCTCTDCNNFEYKI